MGSYSRSMAAGLNEWLTKSPFEPHSSRAVQKFDTLEEFLRNSFCTWISNLPFSSLPGFRFP